MTGQMPPDPAAPSNFPSVFSRVIGTDVAHASVGGLRNVGGGTIYVNGVNGTVTRAYLFWHGITDILDPYANANVQVNGLTVYGVPVGTSHDNFWKRQYSQSYRADVTGMVNFNPNRSYVLGAFGNGSFNPNGATLLILYNDFNTANDYDVTLMNGNDSNVATQFDGAGWNANFGQIYDYNVIGDVMLLIVADGQTFPDPAMYINGSLLREASPTFQGTSVPSTNNGPSNDGNLWDVVAFNFDRYIYANPGYNSISLTAGSPQNPQDALSLVAAIACVPIGPERLHITNPRVGGHLENTTQNALLGADVRLQAALFPEGLSGGNFSWSVSGPYQIVSGSTNTDTLNVRWTETGTYTVIANYTRNGATISSSMNVSVIVPLLSSYTANVVDVDRITRGQGCNNIINGGGATYSLGCFRPNPDGTYNVNNGIVFTATAQIPAVAYLSDPAQSGIKYRQFISQLRKRIVDINTFGEPGFGQVECLTRRSPEDNVGTGWQLDVYEAYGHPFITPVPRFSQGNTLTYRTFDAPASALDSTPTSFGSNSMFDAFYADDRFEMYAYYFVGSDPNSPIFQRPLRLAADRSALYHRIVWSWGGQAYYEHNVPNTQYQLQFSTTTQGSLSATGTNSVVPFQGNATENIWRQCPSGPASSGNRIDGTRFFVRQQYVDILHREPEQDGWNAWTSVMTRCAFDLECIRDKRVLTARGFLESPENTSGNPLLANPGSPEYNREYVRLCYTSFLMRPPDAGGWDGWTNYLNSHPGDYNTVIWGFIYSNEYRRRFGPA